MSVNLEELLDSEVIDEYEQPEVPFPQANDLDKVIDIIAYFSDDEILRDQISDLFEFNERQGDYYANAAVYLNLLVRHPVVPGSFLITDPGREMRRCPDRKCRNRSMLIQLIKNPLFRTLILMSRNREIDPASVSVDEISGIFYSINQEYSFETCYRRSSTVKSWMKWVSSNVCFE